MPDAQQFLIGFGLNPGVFIGGYTLTSAVSTHEQIKRYQEYRYSITLTLTQVTGNASMGYLLGELYKIISKTHVIYGIRNPYLCTIDPINESNVIINGPTATVHLTGHSYRQ